jgi:hypothetical protein
MTGIPSGMAFSDHLEVICGRSFLSRLLMTGGDDQLADVLALSSAGNCWSAITDDGSSVLLAQAVVTRYGESVAYAVCKREVLLCGPP